MNKVMVGLKCEEKKDFWRRAKERSKGSKTQQQKNPEKSLDFSFENPGILADCKSRDPGIPGIPGFPGSR